MVETHMSVEVHCGLCDGSAGGCTGACRKNPTRLRAAASDSFPPPPSGGSAGQRPPAPKGCICPPAANLTCQRSDCGRKDR